MNILIFGAGVIGSVYGSRLHESGHTVTVLARGRRRAELEQHGLVLGHAITGQRAISRVSVVEQLGRADKYDLIIVAVRANQIAAALSALAINRCTPNVLFMVNTATGYDEWVRAVGKERVLVGFPAAGGTLDGPVVRFVTTPRWLQATTIGELNGQRTPRLRALADAFRRAGFSVDVCSDMAAWQKTHVATVVPVAAGLYAAGGDPARFAGSPRILKLVVAAIREGFEVLRTLGVPITPRRLGLMRYLPAPLLVKALRLWGASRHFDTVAARHANAARDEMNELAGQFNLLVASAGVPTPAMDALNITEQKPLDKQRQRAATGPA